MTWRRVVLVELGGDGEGSAIALGRALRDDGMEVIHAGRLETVEHVVRTVEQEDPDALGVATTDPAAISALQAVLGDVQVFAFGPGDDPGKPGEMAAGGRSHTGGTPSDRGR